MKITSRVSGSPRDARVPPMSPLQIDFCAAAPTGAADRGVKLAGDGAVDTGAGEETVVVSVAVFTLAVAAGGKEETFSGLAGMGDLVVTCWSPVGRNRRAGELIAQGVDPDEAVRQIGMTVEGLTTAPVLRDLSHRLGIELPITNGVCAVLGGEPLHELVGNLMRRQPTTE